MEFAEIIIDGNKVPVQRNIPLLQALKERDIILPSMCYRPGLEPSGSCGLCLVEVYAAGAWKVRHACMMQAEEGLRLQTGSRRISERQARAARLLLKRGPFLQQEAEELLFSLINQAEDEDRTLKGIQAGCILCGLCVRICRKIGKNRLTFLGKGKNLRVGLVAGSQPDSCNRCRACRRICPTGFINGDVRQVFTARLYR